MSRQRQRARAERERQQLEARAEQERQPVRAGRRRASRSQPRRPHVPARPAAGGRRRRPRRFGALPVRLRIALVLGWLAFQVLVAQFVSETRLRFGIALATLLVLPVVVVLVRDPRRGSR